jgi:hypothetical protein
MGRHFFVSGETGRLHLIQNRNRPSNGGNKSNRLILAFPIFDNLLSLGYKFGNRLN